MKLLSQTAELIGILFLVVGAPFCLFLALLWIRVFREWFADKLEQLKHIR